MCHSPGSNRNYTWGLTQISFRWIHRIIGTQGHTLRSKIGGGEAVAKHVDRVGCGDGYKPPLRSEIFMEGRYFNG